MVLYTPVCPPQNVATHLCLPAKTLYTILVPFNSIDKKGIYPLNTCKENSLSLGKAEVNVKIYRMTIWARKYREPRETPGNKDRETGGSYLGED